MPIYDYACQRCAHQVEVIHGVHDPGPSECPVCGGPMRKLLSPPAIVFKGSGWAKKERASSARSGAARAPGSQSGSESGGGAGEKSSADKTAKAHGASAGGESAGTD
jgi:putative FmdB family regulatory protein